MPNYCLYLYQAQMNWPIHQSQSLNIEWKTQPFALMCCQLQRNDFLQFNGDISNILDFRLFGLFWSFSCFILHQLFPNHLVYDRGSFMSYWVVIVSNPMVQNDNSPWTLMFIPSLQIMNALYSCFISAANHQEFIFSAVLHTVYRPVCAS